ncbi:ABC transporter permease subunit [Paenarthrobacter nitroguajacolicus]|uniref:ABC transporter permease n=1 Tax=Paenarthrobacter nitroguajacolicus TaxID=211146 RepID=UPI0028608FE7|nr:ABC transporter permease subunit [Paenarthrobacter nitroguajacolicus]MDR6636898.1 ABC-type transport system involved in multi-copper enzyme maturation permease subunit [Paenarthrobacter nitroguajacolicus]
MSSFEVLARKEAQEIVHTWRIWVLPVLVVFFAVIGPPLARITPELLGSLTAGTQGAVTLPPATFADAYGQWIKNLSQIILFAIIIMYGGMVSTEVREGTAAFVLTKPIRRSTFITAKAAVHGLFVTTVIIAGTLATWLATQLVFGEAPAARLWGPALLLLLYALLILAFMELFSVLIPAPAGAAGAGLGLYALLVVGGAWEPLANYSPAGLPGIAAAIIANQPHTSSAWPAVTGAAAAGAAVVLAIRVFKRKEL